MSIKEKIEDNALVWLAGSLLTGFLSGLAAYEGVVAIAKLEVVSRNELMLAKAAKDKNEELTKLLESKENRVQELESRLSNSKEPKNNTATRSADNTNAYLINNLRYILDVLSDRDTLNSMSIGDIQELIDNTEITIIALERFIDRIEENGRTDDEITSQLNEIRQLLKLLVDNRRTYIISHDFFKELRSSVAAFAARDPQIYDERALDLSKHFKMALVFIDGYFTRISDK